MIVDVVTLTLLPKWPARPLRSRMSEAISYLFRTILQPDVRFLWCSGHAQHQCRDYAAAQNEAMNHLP
ncbi:hypothetical protein NP493_1851g00013 [Ridgeia piscesae]|uniref:Uncharacterized protein n=1 Tax=Ridgeia piscesae TaxID=27915 RepID=A0AAD9JRS2_RIDPI|nr:hypothetical protein NP493_1851g00013 [Ridgeia piscesae]